MKPNLETKLNEITLRNAKNVKDYCSKHTTIYGKCKKTCVFRNGSVSACKLSIYPHNWNIGEEDENE